MTSKGFLLATAAGAAFAPVAQAADMPVRKAPGYVEPAASWAGWYIGAHAGINWQQGYNFNQYVVGLTNSSGTGFIGGGQIGVNWQRGNLVWGFEGDISGLSGDATNTIPDPNDTYFASNKIRWLSTVRARFGLAVGDTMAYVTGGVAFGGVRNSVGIDQGGPDGIKSQSKTRVGWTIGGGVEHMWTRNWTVALEGLFVDLGKSTRSSPTGFGSKTTIFSNQAVIGRFKLNYKF